MRIISSVIVVAFALFLPFNTLGNDTLQTGKNGVHIYFESCSFANRKAKIGLSKIHFIIQPTVIIKEVQIENGHALLNVTTTESLIGNFSDLISDDFRFCVVSPGDSITITLKQNSLNFTGPGSEKFSLLHRFSSEVKQMDAPENTNFDKVLSTSDFFEWDRYLTKQEHLLWTLADAYSTEIAEDLLTYLKANLIANIEYKRLLRFGQFLRHKDRQDLALSELDSVFDNSINNKYANWLRAYSGPVYHSHYFYDYLRNSTVRKYGYDFHRLTLLSSTRKVQYYRLASEIYRGYPLLTAQTLILTEYGLKEHTLKEGYSREIDSLLTKFYMTVKDDRYLNYVRNYDHKISSWLTAKGISTYNFSLLDENKKIISKNSLNGSISLLMFRRPHERLTKDTRNFLTRLKKELHDEPQFQFVNVWVDSGHSKLNVDEINWHKNQINLHVDSLSNPVLKAYNVTSFPRFVLLDAQGQSIFNPDNFTYVNSAFKFPPIDAAGADRIVEEVQNHIQSLSDGPYVSKSGDRLLIKQLGRNQQVYSSECPLENCRLIIPGPVYNSQFEVPIRSVPTTNQSTFPPASKIFILSDIEGNFSALTKLLISGGVINNNFDWIFGDGHLVLNGDFFDRGDRVTECLWLIYSLESKARRNGGYVHFILGNHEIMNLNGDNRYLNIKYVHSCSKLGISQSELYSEHTVLGSWLRSKNIVEKIGSYLFVHGGISPEIASSGLSIDSINCLFRRHLSNNLHDKDLPAAAKIVDTKTSPYWYRGYYAKDIDSSAIGNLLNNTLQHYEVTSIITGHTIVADTVSSHFGGKVINVDTRHSSGHSQALLIDGIGKWIIYPSGSRTPLPVVTTSR